MPRPEELNAENVKNQYLPELLKDITGTLDAVYKPFEQGSVSRLDYILIDGKPISTLMCEHTGKEMNSIAESMPYVSEMVLNALVNGQKVSACIPEKGTGAFKVPNLVEFKLDGLDDYLANDGVKQALKDELAGNKYPTKIGEELSKQDIAGLEYTNALLLEKRSKFSLASIANSTGYFLRDGYMRDIVNDESLNPNGLNGQQILKDLRETTGLNLTLDRQAFGSHVIGMLILEGHSPEEIFDPEKGQDILADAGKRFYKMCQNKDLDGILRLNLESTQKIKEVVEKELKEIDYSNEEEIESPRNTALMQLCAASFDMRQESDRHKSKCYDILAEMKGEKIKTDADKEKIAKEYLSDSMQVKALANLYLIADSKRELCNAALGITDKVSYQYKAAQSAMQVEFIKALVSKAQLGNKSVIDQFPESITDSLYALSIRFDDGSAVGKSEYDKIAKPANRKAMQETAKNLLDGEFAKQHRFTIETDANGNPVPTVEVDNGLSRHDDHPESERDFYTADITLPTDIKELTDKQKNSLDRSVFTSLKSHFGIVLGKNGQERLFALNEKNELVSLADKDFSTDAGKRELDLLCLNNRLFAVRENETAPTQLKFVPDKTYDWKVTACDCLDHEPKPVEVKWYHGILARLGFESAKRIIAERDRAALRQSILPSVRKISEERKPLTSFKELSKNFKESNNKEVEKKYNAIDLATVNTDHAMKAMSDIYGQKPVFHEVIAPKGYTKEQFDSLKEYNFDLAKGKVGEAPKLENGKLKLRDVDFVALSMSAAATPEIAGRCRDTSTMDSQNVSKELVLNIVNTMYLNDIALFYDSTNKTFIPRDTIGQYVENTMSKGRDVAAKAIEQYEKGDNKALVGLIANGLAFANRNSLGCQTSPSAAVRAMNMYMNVYADLMEADPELNKAVREKCAEMKAEAIAKKEQNKIAKDKFTAENMDEINLVSAEMLKTNAILSDKKNKLSAEQEAEIVTNQHKFVDEQHPDYVDKIEKLVNYDALDKLYDMDSNLDVDNTINGLRRQLKATEAISKGIDAKKKLMTAEFENKTLPADEKESLMKDIIRGELVLHSETTVSQQADVSLDELLKNNPNVDFVYNQNHFPKMHPPTMPELFDKDRARNSCITSLFNAVQEMSVLEKRGKTTSPITDVLLDPKKGDAALDKFMSDAFPKKDAFKNMKPKYLLEVANGVSKTITDYQKNAINQKKEQEMAAEAQKNMEVNKGVKNDDKVNVNEQNKGLN